MNEAFSKLHALSAVRDDRTLSKAERLVLVMLISHASKSGECFPSFELLADETDMARSVVASAVSRLRGRGAASPVAVTVVRRGSSAGPVGGRLANLYKLTLSPHGLKVPQVESDGRTEAPRYLSPKKRGVESERVGGLSPAGGHQAGKKAVQEAGKGSAAPSAAATFALEPPPAPRAPRARKASKMVEQPIDPRVSELWKHFHEEHQRLLGVAPVFAESQRGGVGKAWKDMLGALDGAPEVARGGSLAEAKGIVTAALADGFHVRPQQILSHMNEFRGNGRRKGRPVERQRGGLRPEVEAAARARGDALAGE